MKRAPLALASLVVVFAALMFVWMSSDSDTLRRLPNETSPVEVGGTSSQDTALAAAPTETASESGASVAPSAAAPRVAATEANALAGRTFADLVVLREGLDGPLMREYEVLAITSDGAARRLRSTDVLEALDGDVEGMFVLLLAGACPRFLDPSVLHRHVAAIDAGAASGPLELRVIPGARLVVRAAPAPSGAAPIERVALHAGSGTNIRRAWRDVLGAATADYEQFVPEGRAWRRLADGSATDDLRAAALRTIRASATYEEVCADVDPGAHTHLIPWVARAEALDGQLVFDEVPTIARLSLVFECADPLEHDGSPSSSHRQRQQSGGGVFENFVLERGETRVVDVHHVLHGSVRGAFPVDACAPFHLEITLVDTLQDGRSTNALGRWIPPPASGGVFEIQRVVPGHHRFAASWHTASGEQRWFQSSIDIAPGTTHDFGTLVDASLGLDLVVQVSADASTSAAGHAVEADGFTCLVQVASGNSFASSQASRFLWVPVGATTHVDGLREGTLHVEVLAVVPADDATVDATRFATRHGLVDRNSGLIDVGSGLVTTGRQRVTTTLPRSDALTLDVLVATVGRVAVDAFVPAEFVRPNPRTQVWFVRTEATDAAQHDLGAWRGDPSGGGYLSGTFTLPVGEWTAFVRLALPPDSAEPRHGVALGRVFVEAGAERPLALELVRGATLDFSVTDFGAPGFFDSLLLDALPAWEYTPFTGFAVGERFLVTGLLPDTNHRTPKGEVVRTGPPGSTTVVE